MQQTKVLTISGVTYRFPAEHVNGFLSDAQNGPFVRVVPPDTKFILEYSKASLRPNEQGPDVPTISYINDVPGRHNENIRVIKTAAGIVVCDPGLREYNCGLRIVDLGTIWNVLFNQRSVEDSALIKQAAKVLLSGYRADTTSGSRGR